MIPCSATTVSASPSPQTTLATRISPNHGASQIATPANPASTKPATSATGSCRSRSFEASHEPATEPPPHSPIMNPNPSEPAPNSSASGRSATIATPMPSRRTIHEAVTTRRTRSRTNVRNPPEVSSSAAGGSSRRNGARIDQTSPAETRNDAAFNTKTDSAPIPPARAPRAPVRR